MTSENTYSESDPSLAEVICICCGGEICVDDHRVSDIRHLLKCLNMRGFPVRVEFQGEVLVNSGWATCLVEGSLVTLHNHDNKTVEIWPYHCVRPVV
jgi:hypothetical protein